MFEYISVFHFTNEIDKKTKKPELNLETDFGAVISIISTSKGKLRNHLSKQWSKKWGRYHHILSSYLVQVEQIPL